MNKDDAFRVGNIGRAVSSRLDQARAGDIEAFTELFEPLRPAILAVARRLVGEPDAEDVVMDTFLRGWKALPGYRRHASLKTWLIRIARNACLDRLRLRRGEPLRWSLQPRDEQDDCRSTPVEETLDFTDPTIPAPDENVATKDSAAMLRAALGRLDRDHRDALLLRFVDELSYADIAAALGVPIGTVMSRLFNGKRKLRGILAEMDPMISSE